MTLRRVGDAYLDNSLMNNEVIDVEAVEVWRSGFSGSTLRTKDGLGSLNSGFAQDTCDVACTVGANVDSRSNLATLIVMKLESTN